MRLVTLTTDFGTRDPYVAQLKAVLYAGGAGSLQVLDLSHELPAQDVREAALFVAAALPRFPAGTIHVVVVDPDVGSARRALAVRCGEQLCVGPDNGVLSLLFDRTTQAVELDPVRLGISQLSATFHGRDLFAPAAAALARGTALEGLGQNLARGGAALVRLEFAVPAPEGTGFIGEVIHVDRFGNLITNLQRAQLAALSDNPTAESARGFALTLRGRSSRLVGHYAEVPVGCLMAVVGSSDRLELAARNASAAELTGARIGDRVRLERV